MNRRKFIRSLIFAAVAATVGGVVSVVASGVYATKGKLGYKLKAKSNHCQKCKHYKPLKKDGECTLQAMRSVMKAKEVLVLPDSSCAMFVAGKHK